MLGRVWPAGQGGDPAPLPCPREAVLHSTTQERQGAAGEGQGGHKDDSVWSMSVDEERLQELGLVSLEQAESGFHQCIQICQITESHRTTESITLEKPS